MDGFRPSEIRCQDKRESVTHARGKVGTTMTRKYYHRPPHKRSATTKAKYGHRPEAKKAPTKTQELGLCQGWSTPSSRLGFVHPLQDVALHQCLPLSSVCCFPGPGDSFLPCYVVLPSSAWSSLLISSLSWVVTLCSVWSTYCPSFLLYDWPISTFVSVCIL